MSDTKAMTSDFLQNLVANSDGQAIKCECGTCVFCRQEIDRLRRRVAVLEEMAHLAIKSVDLIDECGSLFVARNKAREALFVLRAAVESEVEG